MGRPPCCDKSNVKRGLWTAEEDAKILAYVSNHGVGNWTLVPKKAGINRCGKSCRLRWTNYLRPDLKHESFTQQEEELIISLHKAIGSRWSLIAKELPGRTDNDVKNYWNTKLRKKLLKMQIDPVTHKPFPQVLSDYGSISSFSASNNGGPGSRMLEDKVAAKTTSYASRARVSNASINSGGTLEPHQHARKAWEHPSPFHVLTHDAVQSYFLSEATSSSSSSSSNLRQLSSPQSSSFAASQEPWSPTFHWSEFLLSDPLRTPESLQQEMREVPGVFSSCHPSAQKQNAGDRLPTTCDEDICSKQLEDPPSSVDSFVDAILNWDREMTAAFPKVSDGSFDF